MAVVLVAIVTFALIQFRGGFDTYVPYILRADRSGLVMDPGAKVQLHGVQIGRVAGIDMADGLATLRLEIEPKWTSLIPSNATAEIKATTAFGSKYVAINVPSIPSRTPLAPGSTLTSTNVTTEVNTLFESVTSVMQNIDPAKLNATLSAISDGLNGRGSKLGETLVTANQYLSAINPHLPQLQSDFQQTAGVANIYADTAPDFMGILDHGSTTSETITKQQEDLGALLLSAIGFGQSGEDLGVESKSKFVSANHGLVPTTELLAKYSPEYPCLLEAAVTAGAAMDSFIDKTGYSLSVDVALLFGDNVYEYPKHLPKMNAKGGPGGAPGCFAPVTKDLYPQPYLVTDTGVSLADATSIKPNDNPTVLELLLGNTPGGGAR